MIESQSNPENEYEEQMCLCPEDRELQVAEMCKAGIPSMKTGWNRKYSRRSKESILVVENIELWLEQSQGLQDDRCDGSD